MADSTITSLSEVTSPLETDVVAIVNQGATKKVQVKNLKDGLPVATETAKGLMSAADKASLVQALTDISTLLASPLSSTVASADVISIPEGAEIILLTGSTNITSIVGAVPYHTYTFYHLSGSSLSFLGSSMAVGATIVAVYTP